MNGRRGYREVKTPILYDVDLFKQSGHWDKYRDHMYFTDVEDRPMGLKPMNCPAHVQLFGTSGAPTATCRSATPRRGCVHRHEPSGALHGLLRVRHITQDDAHIFCTARAGRGRGHRAAWTSASTSTTSSASSRGWSSRPGRTTASARTRCGTQAEAALAAALERRGLPYELNAGDGAFYGPKIDLHMTDSIGRSWQLGTVQLDYAMPERFGLTYTGEDNAEHRPVMIHRALLGSFERFIGILIEHYAGEFPLWLAPVQAIVLPIADRHLEAAQEVAERLREAGVRAEVDERTESVGRKIRDAELRKVPYMLVVGDREVEAGAGRVRRHGQGDDGVVPVGDVVTLLSQEARERLAPAPAAA